MIPVRLELHNFMAYRDPAPLVFDGIQLACLVGANGAGKSTLLDAITWALWGQTRAGARGEDKLFHLNRLANDMYVMFDFNLSGQLYRVYRRREKTGKSSRGSLDLMVFDGEHPRVISEPTMRDTQAKINHILHLDYDTFINSSLLLQGRADEFTTKRPGERKEVLGNILGLDVWAAYEDRAKEVLKELRQKLQLVEGELKNIEQELKHEEQYQQELDAAKDRVLRATDALRETEERWRVVEMTRQQQRAVQHRLDDLEKRVGQSETDLRRAEQAVEEQTKRLAGYRELLAERDRIEKGYAEWQAAVGRDRDFNERLQKLSGLQMQRSELEARIQAARSELDAERRVLEDRIAETARQVEAGGQARTQLKQIEAEIAALAEDSEVEAGYAEWQAAVERERELSQGLSAHAELQESRNLLMRRIQAARAELEADLRVLEERVADLAERAAGTEEIGREIEALAAEIEALAVREGELLAYRSRITELKEERAGLENENRRLKVEMEELKDRLNRLEAAEGAACPLCGQDLDEAARLDLIERLTVDGKTRGDQYRANEKRINVIGEEIEAQQALVQETAEALRALPDLQARYATRHAQLIEAEAACAELETQRETMTGLQTRLADEDYATDVQAELAELEAQVKALGYDANVHKAVRAEVERLAGFEARKAELDAEREQKLVVKDRLLEQIEAAEAAEARQTELNEVKATLQKRLDDKVYALDEQDNLAGLIEQINALGYDEDAHAAAKADITRLAVFETDKARLDEAAKGEQEAKAALAKAEAERDRWQDRLNEDRTGADKARSELVALAAQLEGADELEAELRRLRREDAAARTALGAAEQKVNSLVAQRKKRAVKQAERSQLGEDIAIYKELRAAFGKNGVPTMVIETVIPEIEEHANQLLSRLTNGQMNLRFSTQREKKSGEGAIETLDIIISDTLGERDYEMYSGGEAFRVNFAIRIALSRLLARRSGAQLRTLIIDEGFGSQDATGRERLVEAINIIKDDFDLIIVITHIEELKDAFPVRIEVEKTADGSKISMM